MDEFPLVSIIMPVYNVESFLSDSISSCLNQTYKNIELIIINDGSTDKSESIINCFLFDKRVRYFKNEVNMKLIATLNKGISLSNGKYIARMDADDISLSDRIYKQVDFLEKNNKHVLVGCDYVTFGSKKRNIILPHSDGDCRSALMTSSPFCHPSVMYRHDIVKSEKILYRELYVHAEDLMFFIELSQFGKIANIPEVLLKYRVHDKQISTKHKKEQFLSRINTISDFYGLNEEKKLHKLNEIAKNNNRFNKYYLKGFLELLLGVKERFSMQDHLVFFIKSGVLNYLKFVVRSIIS